MANGILDFFSREAGQQRRKALDQAIEYYTPPNLRGLLGFAAEVTPTRGIERAGQASQKLFAPDTPGWDRVSALGDMASEIAGVAGPVAVAGKSGMPLAQALQEGLLGISTSPQGVALRNFAGDESGALRLRLWPTGAETPEGRAQGILDLLTSGRASEVTDEMLDLGDPVQNARLNQYLFRNYDLPMDEASRMARAGEIGANDVGYHGTPRDFTAFDLAAPSNTGVRSSAVWSSASPQVSQTYGDILMPIRANQGWPAEIDFGGRSTAYFGDQLYTPRELAEYLQRVRDDATPYGIDEGSDLAFDLESAGVNPTYADEIGGMVANNVDDSKAMFGGDIATNYATFDPRNIRSRFARFDPRLAHLKNLSAGVVAAPLGLLALRPQEEQY